MSLRGLVSSVVIVALVVLEVGCANDNPKTTPVAGRAPGRTSNPGPSARRPASCRSGATTTVARTSNPGTGTVLSRTFTSSATHGPEHLRIYIPANFENASAGTVPLIVLLHGDAAD
ncbi:MAG: hypothetical protein ABIP03_11835 [Aquihabitans sp.]